VSYTNCNVAFDRKKWSMLANNIIGVSSSVRQSFNPHDKLRLVFCWGPLLHSLNIHCCIHRSIWRAQGIELKHYNYKVALKSRLRISRILHSYELAHRNTLVVIATALKATFFTMTLRPGPGFTSLLRHCSNSSCFMSMLRLHTSPKLLLFCQQCHEIEYVGRWYLKTWSSLRNNGNGVARVRGMYNS